MLARGRSHHDDQEIDAIAARRATGRHGRAAGCAAHRRRCLGRRRPTGCGPTASICSGAACLGGVWRLALGVAAGDSIVDAIIGGELIAGVCLLGGWPDVRSGGRRKVDLGRKLVNIRALRAPSLQDFPTTSAPDLDRRYRTSARRPRETTLPGRSQAQSPSRDCFFFDRS